MVYKTKNKLYRMLAYWRFYYHLQDLRKLN